MKTIYRVGKTYTYTGKPESTSRSVCPPHAPRAPLRRVRLQLHSLCTTFFPSPSLFVTVLSSTPHCHPRCCTFPFISFRNPTHDLQSQKHVERCTHYHAGSQWACTIISGLHGVAAAAGEFPGHAYPIG